MAGKFKLLSMSGKGKGLNIFKSGEYKEHERTPMAQLFWSFRWAAAIWIACAIAFGLSFAAEHVWRNGFSPATWKWMSIHFQHMLFSGGLSIIAEIPSWIARSVLRTDIASLAPLIPIIAYYALADATLVKEFNPHGKDKFKEKSSNKATEKDIEKMGKNGSSLFDGFMMVLGYFKHKGKNKPVMFTETLSTLLVAPPGTGKSVGVVIPTILTCDNVSMIINDPKPELDGFTSGYRATIGPTFIMNWAGQDDPSRGIYYPSWNPLSPEHVPFDPEQRDLYIDSMCNTLVAEKAASSADPHWTLSGRATLSGLINFIVSKIERAKANDYFYTRLKSGEFDADDAAVLADHYSLMSLENPNADAASQILASGNLTLMNYVHVGTWADIPEGWRGKEASFAMLLDYLNASSVRIADEMEERRRQGDQMVALADPQKDLFLGMVNEARQYAYAHRSILELTQLANTPDKERGSILSTVMTGLGIFRNSAVRNRTSHSDFHFSDLRGMKDPRDGKFKPISIYLSINMVDAEALNPITAIFIELMSSYLLVNTPDVTTRNGEKMGPYPVLFVLDEMPKMQKMQAVIQGPDLGRGQKISYLMIGQDIHQIQEKYGADAAATIMSTTAAKILLRQNDMDSAKKFSEMIGNKMKIVTKKDDKGKETENTEEEPLYTPYDIMRLPELKQITLIQGWYHRPIEADQERFYLNKTPIQKELYNKVQLGKASPLPEFLVSAHHKAMNYPGNPKIYDQTTKELREVNLI